jgi:hypothetical protein
LVRLVVRHSQWGSGPDRIRRVGPLPPRIATDKIAECRPHIERLPF